MLDREARQVKDVILNPLIALFGRFSPTQISTIGLVFAVITGILLLRGYYFWGAVGWTLNRIFDGLDGIVARKFGTQTDLGGYIDILFDFAAYAIVPITLVIANPDLINWQALVFLLATFYINTASWMYLSALLEKRNLGAKARGEPTSISIPGGIIGGFATFLFYYVFIIGHAYLAWLFVVMGVLVLVGVVQRLFWSFQVLKE